MRMQKLQVTTTASCPLNDRPSATAAATISCVAVVVADAQRLKFKLSAPGPGLTLIGAGFFGS